MYHIDDILREMVQVRLEVLADILRIAEQRLESEWREVVELLSCGFLQESLLHSNAVLVELFIYI